MRWHIQNRDIYERTNDRRRRSRRSRKGKSLSLLCLSLVEGEWVAGDLNERPE
jgi:hypothetical protein